MEKRERRLVLRSILFKLGIIASCCAGVFQHDLGVSGGFMNSIFMAFTIQSNIWIAASGALIAAFTIARGVDVPIPAWLHTLKFMFTTSILLTWIVFALLLTPVMPPQYLASPSNLLLHNLTAVLAFLDFILNDPEERVPKGRIWTALVVPALYTVFFVVAYETLDRIPVQYFFLDYRTYGWFAVGSGGIGVAYWIAIIFLILLGLGAAALRLRAAAAKRPVPAAVAAAAVMLGCSALTAVISTVLR